jgi:radical SAM superfamily enzyme YgiQ (UPF0313 family)
MKLLLTSVFGPYGVNDEYGRKNNKMELFHNQVTKEQGVFSYRFHHSSFGLHFLAANIETPTTVLDFPSHKRFARELKKGYDYIGISFIIPNFKKAQKMAKMIRTLSPNTKIILGGHGTNIPDIENLMEHDYICRGEGIRFLRELFDEDVQAPVKHPLLYSSYNRELLGVRIPNGSGVLVPGVGCENRCRFCATSHFFQDYVPFMKTGKEIFDVCCDYQEKLGVTDFGILDENFLKFPERAFELIECMEENERYFTFGIFSSAETLTNLPDLDILVRLGINFIWMGIESKFGNYEKNNGIDFKPLIQELQRRGISVMGSLILFEEHHDKGNIYEDMDYIIGLQPDYIQFMELGPIPGTKLYSDYKKSGVLIDGVPYEDQHGQDKIWFRHPNFNGKETPQLLKNAFRRDYSANGASFLRSIKTNSKGYLYTAQHVDPKIRVRSEFFRNFAAQTKPFLLAAQLLAKNRASFNLAHELRKSYPNVFGGTSRLANILKSSIVFASAVKEKAKRTILGDARQPPTRITRYSGGEPQPL